MNHHRPTDPSSHTRIYRDTDRGKLTGVCAGLADHFSIDVNLVRIATVISAFMFSFVTITAYIGASLFMPVKPEDLYSDESDEQYWRQYRKSPKNTMSMVRNRFRRLEHKLRKLEAYVTSNKFTLDREFENMDRNQK